MTLSAALRLVGLLLAIIATGSAVTGMFSAIGTWMASSGPKVSMGLVVMFLSGALQSFGQAVARTALALLCFAAARLLEATNTPAQNAA